MLSKNDTPAETTTRDDKFLALNQTAENKPNKRKKTKTFRVFLKKVAIDKDRTIEIDK